MKELPRSCGTRLRCISRSRTTRLRESPFTVEWTMHIPASVWSTFDSRHIVQRRRRLVRPWIGVKFGLAVFSQAPGRLGSTPRTLALAPLLALDESTHARGTGPRLLGPALWPRSAAVWPGERVNCHGLGRPQRPCLALRARRAEPAARALVRTPCSRFATCKAWRCAAAWPSQLALAAWPGQRSLGAARGRRQGQLASARAGADPSLAFAASRSRPGTGGGSRTVWVEDGLGRVKRERGAAGSRRVK